MSIFEGMDWNPNINIPTVWFLELLQNKEYEMIVDPGWAEELKRKYNYWRSPGTNSVDILLKGKTTHEWKVKGKTIPKGEYIEMSLWGSLFQKWNKCPKKEVLDEQGYIKMAFKKESKKIWSITKLENYNENII